jgi:hypothetical protein
LSRFSNFQQPILPLIAQNPYPQALLYFFRDN